jgi:hypothetical protein
MRGRALTNATYSKAIYHYAVAFDTLKRASYRGVMPCGDGRQLYKLPPRRSPLTSKWFTDFALES